jgi:hypothetical protein
MEGRASVKAEGSGRPADVEGVRGATGMIVRLADDDALAVVCEHGRAAQPANACMDVASPGVRPE